MAFGKLLEKMGVLEPTVEVQKVEPVIQPKSNTPPPIIVKPNLGTDLVDSSLIEKIRNVINATLREYKKGNEIDYMNIIDSVEQIKLTIPDERTRFTSALMVAKTMNSSLTKGSLIASVDYYLKCLEIIKEDFHKSSQLKRTNEIDSKQTNLKNIDDTIISNQEQIKKLNEQITALNAQKLELEMQIDASKKKIDDADIVFNSEYEKKKQELIEHKDKINNYIN